MKTWEFKIKMSVADSWVMDGFDASQESRIEEIKEAFQGFLPYAYGHEVKVEVNILKAPDPKVIEQLLNGELEPKD